MSYNLNVPISLFLSDEQNRTYDSLRNDRLREQVSCNLYLAESEQRFQSTLLVIDLLKDCEINYSNEPLFYELLRNSGNVAHIATQKVLEIAEKGRIAPFFIVASTKKIKYYDMSTLAEIIDLFHSAMNNNRLPKDFVPFDQGGKELLMQNPAPPPNHQLLNGPQAPQPQDLDQLSGTFARFYVAAINHLKKLDETHRLPLEMYTDIFSRIKKSPLADTEKVTLSKLIMRSTTSLQHPVAHRFLSEDFDELLQYTLQLRKAFGKEFFTYYFGSLKKNEQPIEDVVRGLALLAAPENEKRVMPLLTQLSTQTITLENLLENLEAGVAEQGLKDSDFIEDIDALVQRFRVSAPGITFSLTEEQLQEIVARYMIVQHFCKQYQHYPLKQLSNRANEIRQLAMHNELTKKQFCELVAIGRLAIRNFFGIYARHTQIFALLGIFYDEKSRIAQVKTGEGKSTIGALKEFVKIMQARATDVITSDPNLAKRDQVKYYPFFKKFDVKTSHLCTDHPTAEKFHAHILYGTASDFEFALMRELLHGEKLFEGRAKLPFIKRNFDVVIVDEVDNLVLDVAMHGARMSFPSPNSYQWIYPPLLQFVKTQSANRTAFSCADIRLYLITQMTCGPELQKISDDQLSKWVASARAALFEAQEWIDYVVKNVKQPNGTTKKEIIIIEHKFTGRLQEGMRWHNGLHEFLEVKHSLPPQQESITPISMSHATFYKKYLNIYGMSGTLGSTYEREEIKTIYDMNSFDVPPHSPSKRIDFPPRIYDDKEDYTQFIVSRIIELSRQGRPILLLCATIKKSQEFEQLFKGRDITYQMVNEMQAEPEEVIISRAGNPGVLTIATNTAGRGTDIILSPDSLSKGGLHVLLSFYPESQRVQDQNVGRCARNGQEGSAEMVIFSKDLEIRPFLQICPTIEAKMKLLQSYRDLKTQSLKNQRICLSKIENYCSEFIAIFFNQLRQCDERCESLNFLNRHSARLMTWQLLDPNQKVKDRLKNADLLLAEECLKLLRTLHANSLGWKIFLQRAHKHIQNIILTEWSLKFHHALDQYKYFEDPNALETNKAKIKELFETNKHSWEKYLAPSGAGIFTYLEELIGINLDELESI